MAVLVRHGDSSGCRPEGSIERGSDDRQAICRLRALHRRRPAAYVGIGRTIAINGGASEVGGTSLKGS